MALVGVDLAMRDSKVRAGEGVGEQEVLCNLLDTPATGGGGELGLGGGEAGEGRGEAGFEGEEGGGHGGFLGDGECESNRRSLRDDQQE